MTKRVKKVLAYVTRGDEMLVFEHRDFPEAGLQVPAGTMEEGEDARDAVVREVYEESGIADVLIVQMLGRYDYDARPDKDEIHDRHVFHLECDKPTESTWLHFENDPADGGAAIAFVFRWIKLNDPTLNLAGGQGALLHKLMRSFD